MSKMKTFLIEYAKRLEEEKNDCDYTGIEHSWGECEIIGYHPPEKVPIGIGYMKPMVRYTCTTCGRTIGGDGGSGIIIWQLGRKTCKG